MTGKLHKTLEPYCFKVVLLLLRGLLNINFVGIEIEVPDDRPMIRKYAFLCTHQCKLLDFLVIIPFFLPEYAVTPSWDSLLLARVIHLRPLIVLVCRRKVYVALREVPVELVLKLIGITRLDLAVSRESDAQLIVVLQFLIFSFMAHLTNLSIRQVDDSIVQISKEVYHIVLLQYVFLH